MSVRSACTCPSPYTKLVAPACQLPNTIRACPAAARVDGPGPLPGFLPGDPHQGVRVLAEGRPVPAAVFLPDVLLLDVLLAHHQGAAGPVEDVPEFGQAPPVVVVPARDDQHPL